MRQGWIIVLAVVGIAGCSDAPLRDAPASIAGPTPAVAAPSLPTPVPGVLAVSLPIQPGDAANTAFGIAPFGYHGADHAADGHPGWDIEYRIGAPVRAAAAGTIQGVFPDPTTPGRTTVQIEHIIGTHHYRTVYTNLSALAADIAVNQTVVAGQALGTAGTVSVSGTAGGGVYAMTHFQLDDFEYYRETPNPNAVSPEPFLTAAARSQFEALWLRAAYVHELIESLPTNPRELAFPASRTWMRAGGDGIAGIRFTRRSGRSSEYEYAIVAESGAAIETGTVSLSVDARPNPTIDLISSTSRRLGVYDIVSNEMRLALADPGAARPSSLTTAPVYRSVTR